MQDVLFEINFDQAESFRLAFQIDRCVVRLISFARTDVVGGLMGILVHEQIPFIDDSGDQFIG